MARELGLLSDSGGYRRAVWTWTRSIAHRLFHLGIHDNPPAGAESLHGPDGDTSRYNADDAQAGEKPAISNRGHQRLGNNSRNARQDVSYEIVESDAVRSLARHKLREHCRNLETYQSQRTILFKDLTRKFLTKAKINIDPTPKKKLAIMGAAVLTP